ncbi:probable mitochondrial saccharopine dehydrogenase-like oxidoreductase At5g39410 [Cajanus cajan]|uniref:Saccharopine dehydrogenase NADP binding domain-containing protein n=1 Tax=Cajanus cajan TaxID=3821 RepID=A0A151TCH2_CAJCA|nr:probable mitochondrial saccharopine dehydrogenase-like oxidoreductase At5g39410 [Cajanus cajan]KYP64713.1 hypothetical protein KK1_019318 [Cajanus cajan]
MKREENDGRFDLIILGASGFTGKYILREALKFLNAPSSPLKFIAIAIAELGVMFNSQQWVGPEAPNSVEAYVVLESEKRIVINFTTYESMVLGVANAHNLHLFRKSRPRRPTPMIPGPPLSKGETIESQKKLGLWAVKLPSADSVVVRRTLAILTENPHGLPGLNESAKTVAKREAFWSSVKPTHFGVKIGSKSLLGILRISIVGVFVGLLGGIGFGRWLLLKFPSIFSLGWFKKKGPTEEEVESASFKMWFVGRGFNNGTTAPKGNTKPDMEIITRVMGPENGYQTTPIILIQCALVVLSQRNNLPKGGVYPPGIIFGPTDLQERLQQNGISFDIISKINISS